MKKRENTNDPFDGKPILVLKIETVSDTKQEKADENDIKMANESVQKKLEEFNSRIFGNSS